MREVLLDVGLQTEVVAQCLLGQLNPARNPNNSITLPNGYLVFLDVSFDLQRIAIVLVAIILYNRSLWFALGTVLGKNSLRATPVERSRSVFLSLTKDERITW